MIFRPWDEKHDPTKSMLTEYTDPPCKHCNYFSPQSKFVSKQGGYRYDGVRFCWAIEMLHDFSCFLEKKGGD